MFERIMNSGVTVVSGGGTFQESDSSLSKHAWCLGRHEQDNGEIASLDHVLTSFSFLHAIEYAPVIFAVKYQWRQFC
jgi:hypothetical protein